MQLRTSNCLYPYCAIIEVQARQAHTIASKELHAKGVGTELKNLFHTMTVHFNENDGINFSLYHTDFKLV